MSKQPKQNSVQREIKRVNYPQIPNLRDKTTPAKVTPRENTKITPRENSKITPRVPTKIAFNRAVKEQPKEDPVNKKLAGSPIFIILNKKENEQLTTYIKNSC